MEAHMQHTAVFIVSRCLFPLYYTQLPVHCHQNFELVRRQNEMFKFQAVLPVVGHVMMKCRNNYNSEPCHWRPS